MMAAAARRSGTTLPASSVRNRGVFASSSARADRDELARAARMRAARARARAVADGFFAGALLAGAAAPASGAVWLTGVDRVVASTPVARRLMPSHRTVWRAAPRKVLYVTGRFTDCLIGILAKGQ